MVMPWGTSLKQLQDRSRRFKRLMGRTPGGKACRLCPARVRCVRDAKQGAPPAGRPATGSAARATPCMLLQLWDRLRSRVSRQRDAGSTRRLGQRVTCRPVRAASAPMPGSTS